MQVAIKSLVVVVLDEKLRAEGDEEGSRFATDPELSSSGSSAARPIRRELETVSSAWLVGECFPGSLDDARVEMMKDGRMWNQFKAAYNATTLHTSGLYKNQVSRELQYMCNSCLVAFLSFCSSLLYILSSLI